jgi:membrane protein
MRTLPQRAPVRLIRRVIEKGGQDDLGTLGAALTYQTLISLIPIVLLAASIVGFIFADDPEKAARWIDTIAASVPGLEEAVGRSLQSLVNARLEAGVIAVLLLAWTGSAMAGSGSHALARICELPERVWYVKRLRSLLELLILGAAALGALVLTSVLPTGTGTALGLLAVAVALVIDVLVFWLVYVILTPPGGPPALDHLPGAIVMALVWTVLKLLGAWYVQLVVTKASAVYGAIGAVIGLVAIVSIAAKAFLYGAELSMVRRELNPRGGPTARS